MIYGNCGVSERVLANEVTLMGKGGWRNGFRADAIAVLVCECSAMLSAP
jgi:hypothetical protein